MAEAARDFGVTERQLRSDLELLWMCGLPGYGPGDLIDLSFEGDRVRVTFTAGMVRPLRLTTDEAVALVVALRTLLELPGLAEREAVSRALAKVSAAAGHAADRSRRCAVSVDAREQALAVVREALERRRALHLHYYVPTRDERTERTVDPMRLLLVDGQLVPGGLVPPRRGRAAVPARPGRRRRRPRRAGRPAAAGPRARRRQRRLPARARVAGGAAAAGPQRPLGGRLLPGRGRSTPVDDPPGGLAVTVRTADLAWARRLVASLGGAAVVDEPAELAARGRRRRPGRARPVRRRRRPGTRRRLGSAPCCC